jgi:hypothetical protein
VTVSDVVLLVALLVIFALWSVGWYRHRAHSWATQRYLSALVSVLVIFLCAFGLIHYVWRTG